MTKKNVGIWIRVSTQDQAEGDSPEHHLKRAKLYAEAQEWSVHTVYDLAGFSGKSVMDHPETKRMLKDVREGKIEALIFSKLARFGRNTKELLEFADIFRKHDAALVSLHEAIDTSTAVGKLFYTIIGALAEWEREEIASRVAASIPIRAKEGKSLGGQAPYGYRWVDKKLELDPDEAPIRRLMFELFVELKRKKTVARELTKRGIRTRRNRPFSDTSVGRLLKDTIVVGDRIVNHTKSTGDGKHWEKKSEEDWVVVSVPPIVTKQLFDEVQQIFESQKRKPVPKKAKHLFAGIVRCECGKNMYVFSNSPKYICKPCKRRIAVADLEKIYFHRLKKFLLTPADLKQYLVQADEEIEKRTRELKALKTQSGKLKKQIDKIYDLYIDDKISKDGFTLKYKPLEEQYLSILDRIPILESEIDQIRVTYNSTDYFAEETKNLFSSWETFEEERKRQVIELLTDSIIVHKDEVEINLHFVPNIMNTEKMATNDQGFIAAISWKWQGKRTRPAERAINTSRSSSGCRNTSSERLENSGSSSKNNTP